MSEKNSAFEDYPRINYIKCPNCGEEHKIVRRAKDLTHPLFVIVCEKSAETIVLNDYEERIQKMESTHDRKVRLAKIESDLLLFTKKKTGSKKDE